MICFAGIPLPVSNGPFAPTSHVHMLVTMSMYVYMYIYIYVYMCVCVKSIILILPLWSLYHYNIIVISSNIFMLEVFLLHAGDMAWEMPGISPIRRWRRGWSMWMCQCPPRRRSSNGIMRSSWFFPGERDVDWSIDPWDFRVQRFLFFIYEIEMVTIYGSYSYTQKKAVRWVNKPKQICNVIMEVIYI